MTYERNGTYETVVARRILIGAAVIAALCIAPVSSGQDRDRDGDRMTRIEPGSLIAVRTTETIDTDRRDDRVYSGIVDQDVRGENDRLAIPRGAPVELIVRVAPDNDLVIDLESVVVNGQRYAIRSEPNREEARPDDSLVGAIVGAVTRQQVRGRTVRIRHDSVLTFRIERPLYMGVVDRGEDRNGKHYHHDHNS